MNPKSEKQLNDFLKKKAQEPKWKKELRKGLSELIEQLGMKIANGTDQADIEVKLNGRKGKTVMISIEDRYHVTIADFVASGKEDKGLMTRDEIEKLLKQLNGD